MSNLSKLLLLTAFFNGLSWIIIIPIWQYPDEQSHFAQVQDIAELGNTPNEGPTTSLEISISEKLLDTERDGLGNNKFTYHPYYQIDYTKTKVGLYENFIANLPKETRTTMVKPEATQNPPLYHIMASNFYRLFTNSDLFSRIYAVRLFSLLIYLAIIIISINAAKLIFSEDKKAQTILPTVIAFTPMLVFSTTGALPDPLTVLLFTSIFTVCLKILRSKLTARHIVLLAALSFLGIQTRQQFQIAVPISLIALLYGAYQTIPKNRKHALSFSLAFAAIIFFILIKMNPAVLAIPEIGIPKVGLIFTEHFPEYLFSALKHYYSQTLPWYWGVYKWLSLTLPHFYYRIINWGIMLSLIGLTIRIFFVLKNKKITKEDIIIFFFLISIFIYFLVFIIWDFYFQNIYGYPFGIQGRYFLTLVLPITTVLVFGAGNLFKLIFKKYLQVFYLTLALFFVLFNDVSLSFVASSYYNMSSLVDAAAQLSQYKPFFLKGDIIIVILGLTVILQAIFMLNLIRFLKNE